MTIIGTGTDLCDIRRIACSLMRFGHRFRHRIFTDSEIAYASSHGRLLRDYVIIPPFDLISRGKGEEQRIPYAIYLEASTLAKRFSAKEAVIKALDFKNIRKPSSWKDIEVTRSSTGKPGIVLHGNIRQHLNELCGHGASPFIHLSLSDSEYYAIAFVTVESRPV